MQWPDSEKLRIFEPWNMIMLSRAGHEMVHANAHIETWLAWIQIERYGYEEIDRCYRDLPFVTRPKNILEWLEMKGVPPGEIEERLSAMPPPVASVIYRPAIDHMRNFLMGT
jgi:hypothetical protein